MYFIVLSSRPRSNELYTLHLSPSVYLSLTESQLAQLHASVKLDDSVLSLPFLGISRETPAPFKVPGTFCTSQKPMLKSIGDSIFCTPKLLNF